MKKTPFESKQVKEVFDTFKGPHKTSLLQVREWIFQQAQASTRVGKLEETLKWGEPSYLTPVSKSGSTLRIGPFDEQHIALYFNCQSTLVEDFRARFGHVFTFSKNRAVLIDPTEALAEDEIRACIDSALLYHVNKTKKVHTA